MSRTLSTGLALASFLFFACGTADGATTTEGVQLSGDPSCPGTACAEPLQPGEACGGLIGGRTDCGKGAYCAYPIALQCGAGDQQGVCTVQPDLCPRGIRYEPVCGCDGNTYDGGCNAAIAGTSVQRVGACDQNIPGIWSYTGDQQYTYTFDPAGTFTRTIRPVCALSLPCPLYIIESEGVYILQGRLLGLTYTSTADQGKSGQLLITATGTIEHLRGTDSGVVVDLTRAP